MLFVCAGNLCRSPLAERLLAVRLRELSGRNPAELGISVASAGIVAHPGEPMDPLAVAELTSRGGTPSGAGAHRLDAAAIETADLVLTAERRQRQAVLALAPSALPYTFTVREFAALAGSDHAASDPASLVRHAYERRASAVLDDYDIADPYRRSAEVHRSSAVLIDHAVTTIAGRLVRAR